jgi:hypothetical protein
MYNHLNKVVLLGEMSKPIDGLTVGKKVDDKKEIRGKVLKNLGFSIEQSLDSY